MRKAALATLLGLSLFALAACNGGTSSTTVQQTRTAQQPTTVREYASVACIPENSSAYDGVPQDRSWAHLRGELRIDIARMERVEPPLEVREFHDSFLKAMKAIIAATDDMDPSDPADAEGLLASARGVEAADQLINARSAVNAEESRILTVAGCFAG